MWFTLPTVPGRGMHRVLIPHNFGRSFDDFPSEKEFLAAVRECHSRNHANR